MTDIPEVFAISLNFPFVQYRSDYVSVKFHAAQEISWRPHFCWHYLSNRFASLGYNKRLAGPRDFVQEREAVGFEMAGRYGFGLLFHSHIL